MWGQGFQSSVLNQFFFYLTINSLNDRSEFHEFCFLNHRNYIDKAKLCLESKLLQAKKTRQVQGYK